MKRHAYFLLSFLIKIVVRTLSSAIISLNFFCGNGHKLRHKCSGMTKVTKFQRNDRTLDTVGATGCAKSTVNKNAGDLSIVSRETT